MFLNLSSYSGFVFLLLNDVLVVLVVVIIADSVAFAAAAAAITFDVTVCVLVVLLNRMFLPLYVLYVVDL